MPDDVIAANPGRTVRGINRWLVNRLSTYLNRLGETEVREDTSVRQGNDGSRLIGVILPDDGSARARARPAERRLVYRIMNYWQECCGEREFPRLDDIDPNHIPDMWPSCFVLDTRDPASDPYFHYLGEALAKCSGVFLSGADDWSLTLLDKATQRFREAIQKRHPLLLEDDITRYDGARLLFRSILLPLSDDGEEINYLLGAANGKIISAA